MRVTHRIFEKKDSW